MAIAHAIGIPRVALGDCHAEFLIEMIHIQNGNGSSASSNRRVRSDHAIRVHHTLIIPRCSATYA
jgi:hypothetical protein